MRYKKIVFFGLGGAGQRHLRILYSQRKKLNLSFFAFRKLKKVEVINKNFRLEKKKLNHKYKDLTFFKKEKDAYINSSIAFICNPTLKHYKTSAKCAMSGMNIFVEKPFFCKKKDFDKLCKIIKQKKIKFLVGYQRRFSNLIIKFKKIIAKLDKKKIKKINVIVNSYLPNWHTYENFKEMYASRKNLGGGSLFTECHELDLIIMFFGLPDKLMCKKFYDVKSIDVESRHEITFFYKQFQVNFKINMFSKNLQRRIFFTYDNDIDYDADFNKNKIYKNKKIIFSTKNSFEKDFKKQINFFFQKKNFNTKSLIQARNNLLVFLACNKSSKINKTVKVY